MQWEAGVISPRVNPAEAWSTRVYLVPRLRMHRTIAPLPNLLSWRARHTLTSTFPLWGFEGNCDGGWCFGFEVQGVCMFYFSKDESWQTIDRREMSSAVTFLTLDITYRYSMFFQHLSVFVNNSQKAAWIFHTDETHQQISFVSKVSPWKPRLRK